MVQITIKTDKEAVNLVKRTALANVFLGINIRVEGNPVLEPLGSDEYVEVFANEFLITTLDSLKSLDEGQSHQFEIGHPFVLKFVPQGQELELYLTAPTVLDPEEEEHYFVDLQEFARATIEASEEFLEFVRAVKPEQTDHWALEELDECIGNARDWYRERYGEEV